MPFAYVCVGSISQRFSSSISGKPIGRVAVHLVRRREDERHLGRVLARGLEHHERAVRVHGEVHDRIARRPVVRRLRRGVHDEREVAAIRREHLVHRIQVADVRANVRVARAELPLQLLALPRGARLVAEEHAAHVVVDAHDVHAEPGEVRGRLRSDQAGRAGDDGDGHARLQWLLMISTRSPGSSRRARSARARARDPARRSPRSPRDRRSTCAAATRCVRPRRVRRDRPPRRPSRRESHPRFPTALAPRTARDARSPSTRSTSSESRSRRMVRPASPRAHRQVHTRS